MACEGAQSPHHLPDLAQWTPGDKTTRAADHLAAILHRWSASHVQHLRRADGWLGLSGQAAIASREKMSSRWGHGAHCRGDASASPGDGG